MMTLKRERYGRSTRDVHPCQRRVLVPVIETPRPYSLPPSPTFTADELTHQAFRPSRVPPSVRAVYALPGPGLLVDRL